jgi:hypothetical protein
MSCCKKCKKPKKNSAELCVACYGKKRRTEVSIYGKKICPSCGKTIVKSYDYCYDCNRKK